MKKRRFVLILGTGSALILALALWKASDIAARLRSWSQERVVAKYLRQIEKDLPFKIEDISFDASWSDFRAGRIPRLTVTLRRDSARLRLSGPLNLSWSRQAGHIQADYRPAAELTAPFIPRPLKFQIRAEARIGDHLDRLHSFSLELDSPKVELPPWSWESQTARARWDGKILNLDLRAKGLTYLASAEQAVSLPEAALSLELPLQLQPFQLRSPAVLAIQSKSAEISWGPLYFASDLSGYLLQINADFDPGSQVPWALKRATTLLTRGRRPVFTLEHRLFWKGPQPESLETRFSTISFALADFWKVLKGQPFLSSVAGLDFTGGTTQAQGNIRMPLTGKIGVESASGIFSIRDAGLRWKEKALSAQGVQAQLSLASLAEGQLLASAAQIHWKKFRMKLGTTGVKLTLAPSLSIQVNQPPPLHIDAVPLKIGPIRAWKNEKGFQAESSLQLAPTPLSALAAPLCLASRIPPATVSASFPAIEITASDIDLTGQAEARLFGGTVRIGELGLFDFDTDVPEIDFDAEWRNIRLEELAGWLHYGQINGTLHGYARDVTFQSWLPTHYDFRLEAKPLDGRDIIFSPEAMKNTVRLIGGDDIDQLPGILDWAYFGWPSEVLGGYDVDCAGISAFAAEGGIMVETVCPPRISGKRKEYFVLLGDRFKMPLRSSHYPLIVDASAMGNFVRKMGKRLSNLSKEGSAAAPIEQERDHESCLPPEFSP